MADEYFDVVAAVIRDGEKILITLRKESSYMAGRWEFPGGKVEKGEKPQQALIREIKEELCVGIKITGLLYVKQHVYELSDDRKRRIKLMFYGAQISRGEIKCVGCSEYRWVLPKELAGFDFVDGDKELVRMLGDPESNTPV
ncbi:MAG: (deoxy)nucleoside triphosphate pyrophosphohydrolase [Candidatus Altiarchaeia archaeon]